jgi:hypothetical protein
MMAALCAWCAATIRVSRRRGSLAKYCSAAHRNACSSAVRRYGAALLEAGLITTEMLKRGPLGLHALSGGEEAAGPTVGLHDEIVSAPGPRNDTNADLLFLEKMLVSSLRNLSLSD